MMLDRLVRLACRVFGRYGWFERLRHPPVLVTAVRPARAGWSGIALRCWRTRHDAGWLRVNVWRLSRRGVECVRAAVLPLANIDVAQPVPFYWKPIDDAAGRRFLVTVHQTDDAGRRRFRSAPFFFTWRRGAVVPVHSEPDPHVAFPEALLVSPVTGCNLNCIHCISRHSRERVSVLSDDVWVDIAAAAADGRLTTLRSDYSGDLLFSDRRYEGDWLTRVLDLSIPFAIDTHANDLTSESIDRLLASRLSSINFSIDSLDPDDYPRIRRGARPLAQVVDNVRRFMAARNATRPDIETLLSFVLMRRNLASLHEAIDLAAELGVSGVAGNHLHAYTPDMAEESLMLEPARYAREYDALLASARAKGVTLGLPPPVRTVGAQSGHTPCVYPWRTMVVLGDGGVMACCVPGTRVGSLRDGSIEQVWNGDAMREFRRRVNSDTPPDACRACPVTRHANNYQSYVPGLSLAEREDFERRCLEAVRAGERAGAAPLAGEAARRTSRATASSEPAPAR